MNQFIELTFEHEAQTIEWLEISCIIFQTAKPTNSFICVHKLIIHIFSSLNLIS